MGHERITKTSKDITFTLKFLRMSSITLAYHWKCEQSFCGFLRTITCCEVCAPDRGGLWSGQRRNRIQNSAKVCAYNLFCSDLILCVGDGGLPGSPAPFPSSLLAQGRPHLLWFEWFPFKNLSVSYLYELDSDKLKP